MSGMSGIPRPILTSLNGDNSWLISFPIPPPEQQRYGKPYFHVVSDAWLKGPATLFATWFVHLTPLTLPAAGDGAAVEAIAREIDAVASAANAGNAIPTSSSRTKSAVDAIFVNFHGLDHMHEPTLRTFHADVPVFAAPGAAPTIRGWNYFTTVVATKDLDPSAGDDSWPSFHPGAPLPGWLSVFRLVGDRELNFATAIVWSHPPGQGSDENPVEAWEHEALIYSPHGIRVGQPSIKTFLSETTTPRVSVLAILHALKESFTAGMATTYGVKAGLALERLAKPKYWVKSHDAPLGYSGLVLLLTWTNDIFRTLQWGLDQEASDAMGSGGDRRPNFVEIENGDCFVLE